MLTATPTELTDKNLFAYCDNNPVSRIDDDGEFWHLVAGAAIGAAIGATTSIVSQVISGDKIDIASVAISAGAGAVSGVLTASGVGIVGQMAGGVLISCASNIAQQNRDISLGRRENFSGGELALDMAVGGVCGAISGAGASSAKSNSCGYKSMVRYGKQSVKKTTNALSHKGFSAYRSTARRSTSYYLKQTRGVTCAMFGRRVRIAYITSSIYNNVKSAFRRWFKK